jgi:hypothetical protein
MFYLSFLSLLLSTYHISVGGRAIFGPLLDKTMILFAREKS